MRKQSSIRMGPGASSLILIFVMLSLSVLAMLSLVSGRNDLELSVRSARVAEEVYSLFENGERTRAAVGEIMTQSRENAADENGYLKQVAEKLSAGITWPAGLEQSDTASGFSIRGGAVCWQEKDGVYTLDCAVMLDPFEAPGEGARWVRHNLTIDRAEWEEF